MISERAINEPRPLKVIYIGAGVSGILGAIEFRKAVPTIELVIYEKNPEIGGTWYENKYPGCACDVPSHGYQLSFESSMEWTKFYADGPEILEYWKKVASKYDIRKHVRLSHKCVEARWDEAAYKWRVRLEKLDGPVPTIVEDEADVLITGTGILNEFKWPNIGGLHTFTGTLLHTAKWDESFDAKDKTVAVIGAGSSGIQVVPALVSQVKAMDHYMRSRTWISPQLSEDVLAQKVAGDGSTNFSYSPAEIEAWRKDPEAYVRYRKSLELGVQGLYEITLEGNAKNIAARSSYEKNMRARIQRKPQLIDQLLPAYSPLCRRLTPGPGYLEALSEPHVTVITTPITSVTATGIISDGVERPVDAIICATGFETAPGHGFPIHGRDGINLRDKYRRRARTYLGVCTDNFPNFFQSLGPNTWQGGGSLLIAMEQVHHYMGQILTKLATGNIRTIEPKRRQVDNFTNHCEEYFRRTVYHSGCTSWYKTKETVTALWPGSSVHALHVFKAPRWEDFEMESFDANEFGWFGNGFALCDRSGGLDVEGLTWYLNGKGFLHEPLANLGMKQESSVQDREDQLHQSGGVDGVVDGTHDGQDHGTEGSRVDVDFADVAGKAVPVKVSSTNKVPLMSVHEVHSGSQSDAEHEVTVVEAVV